MFDINMVGTGINKTISISNTIKIIANKKNRMENGIRAVLFGSNPHSNGEVFSRSIPEREEMAFITRISALGINAAIVNSAIIKFIN